jgi:hypothetical protein
VGAADTDTIDTETTFNPYNYYWFGGGGTGGGGASASIGNGGPAAVELAEAEPEVAVETTTEATRCHRNKSHCGGAGAAVDAPGGRSAGNTRGIGDRYVAHAFLYRASKMVDLNTLIPKDSGWELTQAHSINASGRSSGSVRSITELTPTCSRLSPQLLHSILSPDGEKLSRLHFSPSGSTVHTQKLALVQVFAY